MSDTPHADGHSRAARPIKHQDKDFVESLIAEGMEPQAAATVLRALGATDETCGALVDHCTMGSDVAEREMGMRRTQRTAEGALRLLLLRAFGKSYSQTISKRAGECPMISCQSTVSEEPGLPAASNAASNAGVDDLRRALDVLCLHLAQAELRSAVPRPEHLSGGGGDDVGVSVETQPAGGGGMPLTAYTSGVEFGVGPVERGVGYALVAGDGRAVLMALRALLEEAEGTVTELRESRERDALKGDGSAAATVPDEVGPGRGFVGWAPCMSLHPTLQLINPTVELFLLAVPSEDIMGSSR